MERMVDWITAFANKVNGFIYSLYGFETGDFFVSFCAFHLLQVGFSDSRLHPPTTTPTLTPSPGKPADSAVVCDWRQRLNKIKMMPSASIVASHELIFRGVISLLHPTRPRAADVAFKCGQIGQKLPSSVYQSERFPFF